MANKLVEDGPVRLTEANRLYLYQLLGEALGIGKQVFLPRAEEALATASITPEGLGYADAQRLFAALDDVVRLTAFKGGRFYVTVLRNEAWDAALAGASDAKGDAGKQAKGGGKAKPWKRKKGSLKPLRPKLSELPSENEAEVEAKVEAKPVETEPNAVEAEAKPVEAEAEVPIETKTGTPAEAAPPVPAEPKTATPAASEPTAQAETEPTAPAEPAMQTKAETEPTAPARPTLLEQIEAQAALLRGTDAPEDSVYAREGASQGAQDMAKMTPKANEASQSQATGTARRPDADSPAQDAADAADTPATASAATNASAEEAPAPRDVRPGRFARAAQAAEPARAHDDLPRSFADEVSIKPALFGLLTRLLPIDADPMRVLDEDLRVARATGLAAGSRSRVTFPLRYLQEDGSAPVSVTIRKTTKPGEARRWQLALVDGDDGSGSAHEAVGLEGLPEVGSGFWDDLAPRTAGTTPADPIREMAQFMVMGPWETFLGTVATAAAPESWNYPGEGVGKASRYGVLRDYLATTLARVRANDQLLVAADGSLAAFDTGLSSPMSERLFAVLEPTGTDIPWRFAGITSAGSGELGGKLVATFDELPSQPCYLESIDDVRPRPGALVIPDYRAILGSGLSHLPRLFLAAQLEGTDAEQLLAATESESRHERTEALRELGRTIAGNPGRYRRVCRALDDAIDLSLAAARQSYRHVAPAWDPARGRKLLLLPLALVDDAQVDCALTLELMPSGAYQAAAVVPLPRAHAAARAVSREMPAWL